MTRPEQLASEIRLKGASVSEGIGIGTCYFLSSFIREDIPEFPISIGEVEGEIARYRRALFSSKEELQKIQSDLEKEGSSEAVSLIDTHIQMLEDPLMTVDMEHKIRNKLKNTESVFRSAIDDYERRFSERTDSFFQERLVDVMDVSKRILAHLAEQSFTLTEQIPPNSVVFVKTLAPSHTASADPSIIKAFVTQSGGGNSHAALIARAKGIPFVTSIDLTKLEEYKGVTVIVDGQKGEVIINPSEKTLSEYEALKQRYESDYEGMENERDYPAETLDGYPVKLYANVGGIEDLDEKVKFSSGIGLFRTEYLFLKNDPFYATEEGQYHVYKELLEKAGDVPVVIRVFDIGGDKSADLFLQGEDKEAIAHLRGIRFLLKEKEIFRTQLRAIMRASMHGDLRILLPLISDLEELEESKKIVAQVRKELLLHKRKIKEHIPLGCMIEVPSAVMICEAIARECDFLSMGTNDLVQFTLGVDRSHAGMNDLTYPLHPSIMRMIKMVVGVAKKENKSLCICGEIASNPLLIPLLLGLGLNEFSCTPRYLPMIKKVIRKWRLVDAYRLAEKALSLQRQQEIFDLLFNSAES